MADVTTPAIDNLRGQKDALEIRKKLPLPTPPIGFMVCFYRNGQTQQTPIPGVIVDHGGPGVVDLRLFVKASQNNETAIGVHYKDHPFVEENPQVLKMKNAGTWDYVRGDKAIELHKHLHVQQIDQQIKHIDDQIRVLRTDELKRQALEKEFAAEVAGKKSA